MGRNHFSKYGGPYFMNDGFSGHSENHKPKEPGKGFIAILSIGIVAILIHVAVILAIAF